MDVTWFVGRLAALLSTIGQLPQVYSVMSCGDPRSLALGMYVLTSSGHSTWLTYGFLRKDTALIVANTVGLSCSSYILVVKILNDGISLI
jgi:MtN3 and saliva related transmembrane protein